MLAEVTRQILNSHAELKILGDARMPDVEACIMEGMCHCVRLAAPLPLADKAGEPAQRLLIEAECLADFAGCGLATIADDVCGHRSAQLSVPLVDVLNRLFSFFFGWEIKVNVRPLTPVFAEEPLKEKLHANWIDGGDFQRIADGGVRRAASALNEDVIAAYSTARCPRRSGSTRRSRVSR